MAIIYLLPSDPGSGFDSSMVGIDVGLDARNASGSTASPFSIMSSKFKFCDIFNPQILNLQNQFYIDSSIWWGKSRYYQHRLRFLNPCSIQPDRQIFLRAQFSKPWTIEASCSCTRNDFWFAKLSKYNTAPRELMKQSSPSTIKKLRRLRFLITRLPPFSPISREIGEAR